MKPMDGTQELVQEQSNCTGDGKSLFNASSSQAFTDQDLQAEHCRKKFKRPRDAAIFMDMMPGRRMS